MRGGDGAGGSDICLGEQGAHGVERRGSHCVLAKSAFCTGEEQKTLSIYLCSHTGHCKDVIAVDAVSHVLVVLAVPQVGRLVALDYVGVLVSRLVQAVLRAVSLVKVGIHAGSSVVVRAPVAGARVQTHRVAEADVPDAAAEAVPHAPIAGVNAFFVVEVDRAVGPVAVS